MPTIIATNRLSENQIQAVRELQVQCNAHDGTSGTFFLENSVNFQPEMPCFFLLYQKDMLQGFLCMFAPMQTLAEISACVKPEVRLQGLFKKLLCEAAGTMQRYGIKTVLFVHESKSTDAKTMIERWPVQWEHAEYFMAYHGENAKPALQQSKSVCMRKVEKSDLSGIAVLSVETFGDPPADMESKIQKSFSDPNVLSFCASSDGEIIGVCSVRLQQSDLYIFGFGISPKRQNKGLGRAFLYYVIESVRSFDRDIHLEVDSNNQRAFHLYKTSGFSIQTQFDYYQSDLKELIASFRET